MNAPAVSVVIPVYNDRAGLAACLHALAAQQNVSGGLEVIVVDDGSGDHPEQVLAGHAFARLLRQANAGPAAARNRGAAEARAPILAFIDSDCVPAPDWLAQLIKPFEDRAVSGAQGVYTTAQRSLVARFAQYEIEQRYDIMRRAEGIAMIGTYSAAFRRDVFQRFGGFDARFPMASGEDADFSFRLEEAGCRLVLAAGAVVAHRHPETLWRYMKQKFGRAYWRNLLYRKHAGKILSDAYTPQGLKLEVALLALLCVLALLSPISPAARWVGVGTLVLFAAHSLPLTLEVFRKDPAVGRVAPGLIFCRAVALLAGMVWGFVRTRGGRATG